MMNNTLVNPSLTPDDLQALQQRLQEMARDLTRQDQSLRMRLQAEDAQTSNTFVAGAEGALASEADDEVLALIHHEQGEAREVKEALRRLADGTYGQCCACGEAIDRARLWAVPQASLCRPCQDTAERAARHH